jgi:Protein of unknown function (DUF742)
MTETEIGSETDPEIDGEDRAAWARPYAWTAGRTQPRVELAVEAQVRATPRARSLPAQRANPGWTITQLCRQPRSIAEIAAHLPAPLGVARVLVADLLHDGLVTIDATLSDVTGDTAEADERRELIERVLHGLRNQ